MANLEPKKIDLSTINNGKKYENGDGTTPETFNAPIEASAYAQDIAELAKTSADNSVQKVAQLETQIIDKQGTAIFVGNIAQNRVDFKSDPQTQIDTINSDISALTSLVNGKLYAKEIPLGFIEIPSNSAEYPNITHADISADGFVPLFGILKYYPFNDASQNVGNKAGLLFPINTQSNAFTARTPCCYGYNGDNLGVCSICLAEYKRLLIYNYNSMPIYIQDVIYVGYYQ